MSVICFNFSTIFGHFVVCF